MLHKLKNEQLTVTLSTLGAEVVSVLCGGGCEYIWQGDAKYWAGRAPLLFPICGRLFGGKYTYGEKEYEMNIHGFARASEFTLDGASDSEARFTLKANSETKKLYPFDFELTLLYRLDGARLSCEIEIRNTGDAILPAGLGLHPGFNVPLDSDTEFEDYYLEFSENASPDAFILSETCFMTGRKKAFPLIHARRFNLAHDMFDNDAIFLDRVPNEITLKSDKTERFVKFEYPDMRYVGFWHAPHTDAPYVCIEPWCSLPSYDGIVDDFSQKNDMFRLLSGEVRTVRYALTFG